MPYKIYTYADPYRIAETDFWDEIKNYPHFCAARTLVNGLISVMRDDISALMCPLDDIVNEKIFKQWANDIGLRIQQYSALTEVYKNWNVKNGLDTNYYSALTHNKDSMLDALRLFIELDIDPTVLDARQLNMEHRMFVYMLKLLGKEKIFSLPKMPSRDELKVLLNQQAQQEKDEKVRLYEEKNNDEFLKRDLELIDRMIATTRQWDAKHVVIHGIHQFTPLQLKFIKHLDKLGVEVIFMFNYLPEYKEVYSSWSYIYQQFDAPIHHDTKVKTYIPTGQLQKTGNAIASNIGLLCEDKVARTDARIKANYSLYSGEKVQEFDNVSEFAGYISDEFMDAERTMQGEDPLYEKPMQKKATTAAVLARMDEIVYTANKDVDELLQVYHPEYSRNRHFLAYPIGQFFSAIYSLWNVERGEIDIEFALLRECLNSGIMSRYSAERLLKTLMNLEPLFANVETFTEFKKLFEEYQANYAQVVTSNAQATIFSLRIMNIYNSYKVSKEEIDDLSNAISELNEIAVGLFSSIGPDERFEFKKHFERLNEFVRERQASLASEEEKKLITDLLTKLDLIQMMGPDNRGTFDDLRSGLYFFLKQKEEPLSDWFVKNFEQIDGDVLNSKAQNSYGRKKVYHFACVSDKDMNKTIDELLPWPLSEQFIEKAYNPKDLQFQVYYAALGERSNFLRYALFYGLYFNQCDTKISFVKRYGEDTTDYYEMLKLIGLEKEDGSSKSELDECSMSTVIKAKKVESIPYVREQMAAMFLCPYKYLLDYVLNPQPIFSGAFMISKCLENILIENTWRTLAAQSITQDQAKERLTNYVSQESMRLSKYFKFFKKTEILDIQRRVENYIKAKVFVDENRNKKVRPLESTHMLLRKTFGDAWFKENIQDALERHLYDCFDKMTTIEDGMLVYSTHKVPKEEDKQLIRCTLNYLNDVDGNMERVGSWCVFCPNKNLCLKSFAQSKE